MPQWASLLSAKSGSTSLGKLSRKRQPFFKETLGKKFKIEECSNAEVHSLGCTTPFKHFQLLPVSQLAISGKVVTYELGYGSADPLDSSA